MSSSSSSSRWEKNANGESVASSVGAFSSDFCCCCAEKIDFLSFFQRNVATLNISGKKFKMWKEKSHKRRRRRRRTEEDRERERDKKNESILPTSEREAKALEGARASESTVDREVATDDSGSNRRPRGDFESNARDD